MSKEDIVKHQWSKGQSGNSKGKLKVLRIEAQ